MVWCSCTACKVFYKAVLRAFITLTMQSAMAHEVAVPSLQAEPPSYTAVQETQASPHLGQRKTHIFIQEFPHLAQHQDQSNRRHFCCKATTELIPCEVIDISTTQYI